MEMGKVGIGCICATVSLFVSGLLAGSLAFVLGEAAGSAHKASETTFAHWRGLREGFVNGARGRKGLLGVPFGERCEIDGRLIRPLKETKRDREECVHVLETEYVNGKWHRQSLIVVLGNEENAKRIKDKLYAGQSGHFVGYETLVAVGSPEWDGNRDEGSAGYSIENRFVITEVTSSEFTYNSIKNESAQKKRFRRRKNKK